MRKREELLKLIDEKRNEIIELVKEMNAGKDVEEYDKRITSLILYEAKHPTRFQNHIDGMSLPDEDYDTWLLRMQLNFPDDVDKKGRFIEQSYITYKSLFESIYVKLLLKTKDERVKNTQAYKEMWG
jgi:hypothetical protein